MSQQYSAQEIFTSEQECELRVSSAKCQYYLWINGESATLRGPGVRENGTFPKTNGKLDNEDFAILIILLFENGLWPGEEE
jgi:hypothetical protein